MKLSMVILAITAQSTMSFAAQTRVATPAEVNLICTAVSASLAEQESDIEVDESCDQSQITASTSAKGVVTLKGDVITTWAGILGSNNCKLRYRGDTRPENIIGGLNGVRCD